MQVRSPLVFWGGEVVDAGNDAHEETGDAGGGNCGTHKSHGEDGEEFGFPKGNVGHGAAQEAVDECEEQEGGEEGQGEVRDLHPGSVDDVFGGGDPDVDTQDHEQANEDGAQGDSVCL